MHKYTRLFTYIFLFLLASFLRVFRIYDLTDFLGDQGRTGLVISHAFVSKTIPLVGPTVLTGQHVGPFFYYIVGPALIFSGFHPVGMAIFLAILGILSVLILFYVGLSLFDFTIAFFLALLYGVSPYLVTASRQIWEPTCIPFFITLLLLACVKIYIQRKFVYLLLIGGSLGVLFQLHYPNTLLVIPTVFFLLWTYVCIDPRERKKFILWTILAVGMCLLTLFPFLLYEWQQKFVDLRQLIALVLFPSTTTQAFVPKHVSIVDFTFRLFKYIFPINSMQLILSLACGIIGFPFFIKRSFWHFFFTLWLIFGVVAMSFYKGIVFNHYLNFLLPVPFLLLGSFLHSIKNTWGKRILYLILIVVVLVDLSQTDIFSDGPNDIKRTQDVVNKIITLTNKQNFSFTLIRSESFSDLHYRYFFSLQHITPQDITSKKYTRLFLVCEKGPCPTFSEMQQVPTVTTLCYDPHCQGDYPKVDLQFWKLQSQIVVDTASVYTYKRN